MATACLPLILLLATGVTTAPLSADDGDIEVIVVANADLEDLHPRQVIEGDIILDSYTRSVIGLEEPEEPVDDQLLSDENRKKKAVNDIDDRIWPGGVVPYLIGPFIGEGTTEVIHTAMKEWMDNTCIKFVARTDETDYVRIVKKQGCASQVGRIGGEQELWVGDDTPLNEYCRRKGTILHELGHLIGFWHEQSRHDRDNYVTIVWDNIIEGAKDNFRKHYPGVVDSRGVKYDYASIMHYRKRAFGIDNEVTIIPKQKGVKIGQRRYLSPLDIKQANILYNCKEKLIEPEPTILIRSIHDGLCIEVQSTIAGVYIPLLNTCNQNSAVQQWKWNKDNQLYNPDTLHCISTGPEKSLEMRSCISGDVLQQWLCANHFIEHASTGNCITVKENTKELIAEQCNMENYRQLWNKYNDSLQNEIGFSLIHLLGDDPQDANTVEPICTIPHIHTIPECYNETVHLGWSSCQLLGYFVIGLYHMDNLNHITKFLCCYTSHAFTGQPETASSVEQEICDDVTWWSSHSSMGWFKCPTGSYFKGFLRGENEGLLAVQLVRCCRTVQAPSIYRHCYTDSTFGSEGLHDCSRAGYHIAGIYKTDCHLMKCIEKLLCCI